MAQFTDPIAGYAIGANPIGSTWTVRSGGVTSSTITSGTTPVGDRYWRLVTSNITWTSWDTPGTATTQEVLLLVRRSGADQIGGCARLQTGSDTYWGGLRNNDLDTRVAKMISGGQTSLATGAHGITSPTNKWVWVRLQVTGTTVRARCWEDGTSEPGTWQATATDSAISTAGYAGWMTWSIAGTDFDLAYISLGTAGDAAPSPSGGGGGFKAAWAARSTITLQPGIAA